MTLSLIDDKSEREDIITTLIEAGVGDANLSKVGVGNFFAAISGLILIYERKGINLIPDWIDQEIITNEHGQQAFLLTMVEPGPLTGGIELPAHVVIKAIIQ